MTRFFVSLFLGLAIGLGIGLILGWGVFPVETVGNPASRLAQDYKDEYTVMIAAGFRADGDLEGAVERLQILDEPDIRQYIEAISVRFIQESEPVEDIVHLLTLARGLGVPLTEQMEQLLAIEPANTP